MLLGRGVGAASMFRLLSLSKSYTRFNQFTLALWWLKNMLCTEING